MQGQSPTKEMYRPKVTVKEGQGKAVLAVTKAAKDVQCAVRYQQDRACMALIPSIQCMGVA